MSDKEDVEVSAKGVILKGAYADLRPAIQRSVKVAETVLSVIDNLVGLPADFLNHHLTTFRDRYRQRLEAIPPERRDVPPLRIGCSVLKAVAFAAEEPEIQTMFADLLGTSSDIETRRFAHPGFADIINQLVPLDAKILRETVRPDDPFLTAYSYYGLQLKFNSEEDPQKNGQIRVSVDNLVRLGLLAWEVRGVSRSDRMRLTQNSRTIRISSVGFSSRDTSREVRELKDAISKVKSTFDDLAGNVSRMLEHVGEKDSFIGTQFGRQFVLACLADSDRPADAKPS